MSVILCQVLLVRMEPARGRMDFKQQQGARHPARHWNEVRYEYIPQLKG